MMIQDYMCAQRNSDQPSHLRSLIKVFLEHSVGSQGFKVSSGGSELSLVL